MKQESQVGTNHRASYDKAFGLLLVDGTVGSV